MIVILSHEKDPYFNIASEEYLLKNFSEDIIYLYRNRPSVIIGKHQNTAAEIDLDYLQKNKIPVIRRISGGGTVYHDEGNINFAFIRTGEEGKLVNFEAMVQPIREFLDDEGIPTVLGAHNELLCGNLKISGNAEHLFRRKVLHHGTLLFRSNLDALNSSIAASERNYKHKGVKSNRTVVGNIAGLLNNELSTEEFMRKLYVWLKNRFQAINYQFSASDRNEINELVKGKYSRWNWNFAYSPDYIFTKNINHGDADFSFALRVKKGLIYSLEIETSHPDFQDFNNYSALFSGVRHNPKSIRERLSQKEFNKFWESFPMELFLQGFYA